MKNKAYVPYSTPDLTYLVAAALFVVAVTLMQGAPPAGKPVGAGANLGAGIGLPPAGVNASGALDHSPRGSGAPGAGVSDTESIGLRQDRLRAQANAGPTANAEAHASVMGKAEGLSVAALAAGGTSVSLNHAEVVHEIHAQAADARADLLAELHTRVGASTKAMAQVRKTGAKLDGDAKANFTAAAADVKAAEKTLNKSIKAAEKADADTWVSARARLAADYDAYASAVERAEAASHVAAGAESKPKG